MRCGIVVMRYLKRYVFVTSSIVDGTKTNPVLACNVYVFVCSISAIQRLLDDSYRADGFRLRLILEACSDYVILASSGKMRYIWKKRPKCKAARAL